MSENRPTSVLGSLPHTRPNRRSPKRPPVDRAASRAVDSDGPAARRVAAPPPAPPRDSILTTAIQATAELAEIGLTAGARALRDALARLPHP